LYFYTSMESAVDIKKFTAFIAFNDELRDLYYDVAESRGINSTWDVYHIQEGTETPRPDEVSIMQEIYDSRILSNANILETYNLASQEFRNNVRKKIEKQTGGSNQK